MDLKEKAEANRLKLANASAGVTTQATETAPNPSNPAGEARPRVERKRIPMTLPTLKLNAPEIPGYFTYWMRGTPDRLLQADRAGYEFVTQEEALINNVSLGGDAMKDGSTDMGSRVSVLASTSGEGEKDASGQPLRLYLMKQKMEYHLEDQAILERQNDGIADALSAAFDAGTVGGKVPGETTEDFRHRYVDKDRSKRPDLFKPKRGRASAPR